MRILAKLGAVFIILVILAILLYFYDKPLFYSIITSTYKSVVTINSSSIGGNGSSTIMKEQYNFTTAEINAITKSSPVPIKQVLVFGSWKNTTQRICGQQQANFGPSNPSQLNVLYDGFYAPIYLNVQSLGNSAPNLIGQKVYLDFILNNNKNVSASYIVKSEVIKNNMEYWNFTFDGNTSNAINSMLNETTAKITTSYINGVVLQNGTALISPTNNGNFIAPIC